jgi:hypothetical protein
MSNDIIPSLINLPIELIYRIFDHLNPFDILISVRDVCTKLNTITDTYYPYQIIFTFFYELHRDEAPSSIYSCKDEVSLLNNTRNQILVRFLLIVFI